MTSADGRRPYDAVRVPDTAKVTGYTLSLIDLDLDEATSWCLTVEWRGDESWAIKHNGFCLNRDGEWEWEPSPSNRDDAFLLRCRYDEQTALVHAHNVLPSVTVNGMTAEQYLARWQAEQNAPRGSSRTGDADG